MVFQQKCIDYIKKNDHKWSFFYIIYTFLFGNNTCIAELTYFAVGARNTVIKVLYMYRVPLIQRRGLPQNHKRSLDPNKRVTT